jgi:hypothetical protein
VTDANSVLPTPRVAAPDDESGRGLALVAALAEEWGSEARTGNAIGKTTWFRLRAEAR